MTLEFITFATCDFMCGESEGVHDITDLFKMGWIITPKLSICPNCAKENGILIIGKQDSDLRIVKRNQTFAPILESLVPGEWNDDTL